MTPDQIKNNYNNKGSEGFHFNTNNRMLIVANNCKICDNSNTYFVSYNTFCQAVKWD